MSWCGRTTVALRENAQDGEYNSRFISSIAARLATNINRSTYQDPDYIKGLLTHNLEPIYMLGNTQPTI